MVVEKRQELEGGGGRGRGGGGAGAALGALSPPVNGLRQIAGDLLDLYLIVGNVKGRNLATKVPFLGVFGVLPDVGVDGVMVCREEGGSVDGGVDQSLGCRKASCLEGSLLPANSEA